ncbi:MAG: LysM peptidoglycan-binding domain-containing protein [Alphaproteobacteria bacterium]|nr:LysM peptidoglycan-binding domain-containing protein [Alphaproteobacteria bacterium]
MTTPYENKERTPFQKGILVAIAVILIGLIVYGIRSCSSSEDVASVQKPEFDTVQIEKGKGIITGRAGKETEVHIVSGDKEIGIEKTDTRGEFVFLPEKDFTAGVYEISLFVIDTDGNKLVSDKKAILTVPSDNSDAVAVLIGKKETKLIQSPKREKGAGAVGVSLVEYDLKEKFSLMGYGQTDHKVRLYINNTFLAETNVDDKGWWQWKGEKKLIQDRAYTLRVDMINSEGKVVARVENKFSTEAYEGEPNLYVVKKGDCLWRIAKREYGRGIDYVLIFKANKSQIRNPDLIYPNQIFKVPEKK